MVFNRVKKSAVLAISLLALAMSASVHAEDNLNEWKGQWISGVSLLNKSEFDQALQAAYKEQGEKEGISGDEWKQKKMTRWNTAIQAMNITDDNITFTLSGDKQVSGHYRPAGDVTTKFGEHELKWHKFTSDDQGVWRFIMLMEPEKSDDHEELTHFHFRYGNDNFGALETATVFPTMVAPDTTAEQFAHDFAD